MTDWRTKTRRLLVLPLLLVGGCGGDDLTPVVPEELARMEADQVIFGMRHNVTVDGVRQARVVADTSFGWNDSTAVALRNPDLTVYHEDGREKAVVTSREGRLDQRTDQLTAMGNVVLVVPDDGRRIETEELHYDPQSDRISSPVSFVMYVPDRPAPIRGTSFESDLEFRNFRMTGEGDGAAALPATGIQRAGLPPGGSEPGKAP